MSTLRTDTLQTTDSSVTVQVADLSSQTYIDTTFALPVDNIAALKTVSKLLFNKASVGGYYSKGDGGGFDYYLDSADTTSTDNGGTVIVANDGGRWKAKVEGSVTTRHFGAKVDGVAGTNDAPAIQKALIWCAANNRSLDFATGISRLLTPLTIPSNSDLVGQSASGIYLDPTMTLGASVGGSQRAILGNDVTNVRLTNLNFSSTSAGLTKAITVCFNQANTLHVTGCSFKNFGNVTYYAQGLVIFDSPEVHIERSTFSNNSGDGLAMSNGCTNFSVNNSEFSNNSDWGFALVEGCNNGSVSNNLILNNSSTGTGADRCSGISFTGNTINNNEHGIRIAQFGVTTDKSSFITISGNNINGVLSSGISIESTKDVYGQFTIMGNNIAGSSGQGISVINSRLGTIIGNTIYSTEAESILINSSGTGFTTGLVTVSGNVAVGGNYNLRQLAGGGSSARIVVGLNHFSGASVAPLAVIDGDYIDSSSINYFDVSKAFNYPSAIQSNTATAGGTTAPAQVQGYLPIYMGGVLRKVPFYNT